MPPAVNLSIWFAWMVALAGLAAILGHSKSIWLGFTGGKSVATSLGVLLAMSWQVGLSTLLVFGVVLALSRIVSLSSIAGAVAVSVFMLVLHQPLPYQLFALAGGLYVILRHRSNIERLLAGIEPRLGQLPSEAEESLN
jgi:glycerol-3-phosphate acyltransferase PlsY